MSARGFVKSADTAVPVSRSKSQLEAMLIRYGASGFSVGQDYTTGSASVQFVLPDAPGAQQVPVRIPLDVLRVFQALNPKDDWGRKKVWTLTLARATGRAWDQAERVAWRNLVLWVDAAMSAATLGLQTITEAFFAHTVVGEAGERMIDVAAAMQGQLGAGVQRLLAAPPEEGNDG